MVRAIQERLVLSLNFFADFVRDGSISLYDGIAKMTSIPAKRLGLAEKGRLNVGADADVVIFDPEKIRDGATFDDPWLPPSGIDYDADRW